MIQLAWLWIRHQPQSALTRWFKERSPQGRKRAIVALARKLLVALWKYVTQGVVIGGGRDEARRLIRDLGPAASCNRPPATKPTITHPPRPDQPRKIRVDEPMDCMASTPQRRMVSSSRACPPQAESWCSRLARRPNVSFGLARQPRSPNRLEPWIAK